MSDSNRGARLLRLYLETSGQAQAAAARAAGVSDVTAHHWLGGTIKPRPERRQRLEEWSKGAVPATAWDQPEGAPRVAADFTASDFPPATAAGA